jgi:hypothetical protein
VVGNFYFSGAVVSGLIIRTFIHELHQQIIEALADLAYCFLDIWFCFEQMGKSRASWVGVGLTKKQNTYAGRLSHTGNFGSSRLVCKFLQLRKWFKMIDEFVLKRQPS